MLYLKLCFRKVLNLKKIVKFEEKKVLMWEINLEKIIKFEEIL